MKQKRVLASVAALFVLAAIFASNGLAAKEIVRPEEIKSLRQVAHGQETYVKLEKLWKEYYNHYPSEYAYANWMYAARYAQDKKYQELVARGLRKYPANPTLLYLKSFENAGAHNDVQGLKYLERAIAVDPNYIDAWFGLVVHYMDSNDQEKLDLALRHVLESGIIADEVMDYNYNVLITLNDDAILVTNGDNDTYPGWILTRILKVRSDVTIVNRSLLNTDWYPMYLIEHGLPRFINKSELDALRSSILQETRGTNAARSPGGLFGDVLIFKIIESAKLAGRPVYVSKTVYATDKLKDVVEKGRDLGLITLVTPSEVPYAEDLRKAYGRWIEAFRTGGLESWRLGSAPQTDAGLRLISNYAPGVTTNLEALKKYAPELRSKLFHWYINYEEKLLSERMRDQSDQAWCCDASDVKEIETWCKEQGLECKKQ